MIRNHSVSLVVVGAAIVIGVALALRPSVPDQSTGTPTAEPKTTFQAVCATCHGSRGEGNRELGAPTIASLPEWFVTEQLTKFRAGLRGTDPRDTRGQQMRAAVLPLSDDAIAEAVDELISLPAINPASTLSGNVEEGALSFRELCMECHRFNAHGELAFKSAPLAALPDWYLAAQIPKFLDGTRGYHPEDEAGAKMREMAKRPRNQEELVNILSFIGTLAEEYPIEKE